MIKRVISLFVSLLIVFSFLTVLPFTEARAQGLSLTQLQSKFPQGAYWNHAGSSTNNPDGYTWTPCTHHGSKCSKLDPTYSGKCGCNSFSASIQCMGFANKLGYDAFGSVPTKSWSRTTLSNVKPGDVIRYKNNGHSIFVTGVNGNTITYADCNSDGKCKIMWNKTISKSEIQRTLTAVYSAPGNLNTSSERPSNVTLSKNQNWYDIKDTIVLTPSANNANTYWMSITKDGKNVVNTQLNGEYSISASALGYGDYHAWITAVNSAGSTDSAGIDFSVVGAATYSNVWTSKPIYDLEDTVSVSVSTVCAKGQCIGIDKEGVGRVVTQNCEPTYTVSAKSLGAGKYSAYFSVFNGSGGVDTKRVEFVIANRENLGTNFYARIKNTASNKYVTNVNSNVMGRDLDCSKSQVWKFVRQSDESYKILSALDNKAMDIDNFGDNGNGTNIQVFNPWDCTAQKFYIYKAYGGQYIKPIPSDLFVDMQLSGENNVEAWGGGVNWDPQKFEIIKVDINDVGEHTYANPVTTPASCTQNGAVTYTCSVCGQKKTETIPALGHLYSKEWTVDKKETCTVSGSKSHHCTRCDMKTDITEIPAAGHTFNGWVTTLPPTSTTEGIRERTCSVCGKVEKQKIDPVAAAPQIVVENKTARAGDTVSVQISIKDNPGIIAMLLQINYDSKVLELESSSVKDFADTSFGPISKNPFTVSWEDSIHDNTTTDGCLVELVFRVKDGAASGSTPITVSYNEDNIFNSDFENVFFEVVPGAIQIVDCQSGDINGDGKLNMKDYALLRQYLNGSEVRIERSAADVNRDDKINMKDLALLRQYLNGWDVVLQ